ncbi:MAG TPA: D-glycero-beta-D-manno-heptose 1-phosphate adenylyltransferase [Armatimonadota bacterium]|nr:D-glycero-beta-D-manno-heptose 1-phosphate adenylyltransferase [Armatimonadota bacterium]HOS42937.1 D-glycero-beta-D-manno-heptose 1-phosphate adenylyltransferase [Armatimonadota bacterium]
MTAFTTTAGNVFTRDTLCHQVEIWRAQGQTIVLTNGCFDLLHVGHIETLEAARTHGNVLIVGVNSDASVRKLKGPGRPLNAEGNRARVIAALACVDAVTIFDESTASALLAALRPHVYVKGGDYDAQNLPERAVVAQYGIAVVFCPLVPDLSTTQLIAALRAPE